MLPILVVAIAMWLVNSGTSLSESHQRLADYFARQSDDRDMLALAGALNQYIAQTRTIPADLMVLVTSPGYEHVRHALHPGIGYAVSPTLTDGTWKFRRAVLFSVDRTSGETDASYLARNTCGTNDAMTETSRWCGGREGRWHVIDERDVLKSQIYEQSLRLNAFTHKLANYYNKAGELPAMTNANAPLGASSVTALADLAGYAGDAKHCSGTYVWKGIPVDCAEMFDVWGGRIGYQFEDKKHVIVVSESPYFNADSDRKVVAADYAIY